jgi:predicted permease
MDSLLKDIRYAARTLVNAKGFAAVAIVTLALGIGANTAMFSVVNSVLLRPLPYRNPDRIFSLQQMSTRHGEPAESAFSYADFADYQAQNRTFEDLAAYNETDLTLSGAGEATHIRGAEVSSSAFRILGVQPTLGRDFLKEEDKPGQRAVILSQAFWASHFKSDPETLGKPVTLSGKQYTIVGVMPAGFQFPVRSETTEAWVTFARNAEISEPGEKPITEQRGAHWLRVMGRPKDGVSLEQAQADLTSIAKNLATQYPDTNLYSGIIRVQPFLSRVVGKTRRPLLILLLAVGCVLLIACANVANLVLARNSGRSREIAIRAALGASRTRIVRHLVTESILLSVCGAALGTLIASWGLSALVRLYPDNLPRMQEVGIDMRVLLFTAALSIASGVLFGLVPALRVSTPNLNDAMREGGRGTAGDSRHTRLRSSLVVAETAIGVMLLIGAGLLMRSLNRLSHVELGLNPANVLTANIDLSQTKYKEPEKQDQFNQELLRRLKTLPGVQSAALALQIPLGNDSWTISFDIVERRLPKSQQPSAAFYNVSAGFFETLQIPLLQGRTFDDRDQRDAAPVMIVNNAFARKYFANENPIGKMVEIGGGDGKKREHWKTREIVGIVGDIRNSSIDEAPVPTYFVPMPQLIWGPPEILVRTASNPTSVTADIRKALGEIDAEAPLFDVRTVEDYFALDLGRARFQATLLGIFAGVALLLTAIGLYGVMAYAVAQRTREIGIRMALGASRGQVLSMVLHRGVILTLSGIGIGVIGALALARFIAALLYEIPPRDPLTYIAVSIGLGCVALLASYIPALRATRVDPMVALRYE